MENRNRTLVIVIVVVVVLLLLCCIAVALIAGAAGWFVTQPVFSRPFGPELGIGRVSDTSEMSFDVGSSPALTVDNFAGNVTVRQGEEGVIRIVATRHAPRTEDLERISVEPDQEGDRVSLRTDRPAGRFSNVMVELDIIVPAGTMLDLDSGAGDVSVEGVTGAIDAHTGAGNVQVRGAEDAVRLDTGAGNVDYEGQPRGESTFSTGAGNITLRLPADVSAEVDLDTGIGNVELGGFDVAGDVSRGAARGTLGTGEGATIEAHTGAGNVTLVQR